MEHVLYSDGDAKKISWAIKTDDVLREQSRDHADIFLDKVSKLQSKYIALHVGIFWSIGVFIIKNGDTVRIKLDLDEMIDHLSSDKKSDDLFIESRKGFINQIVSQRDLKLIYEKIIPREDIAKGLL